MNKPMVLLESPEEMDLFAQEFSSADKIFVTPNYFTLFKLKDYDPLYFYEKSTGSHIEMDEIYQIGGSWYKDLEGRDLLRNRGISVGPVITRRVLCSLANDYRNFKAITRWSENHSTLYLSKSCSASLKRMASFFKGVIIWFGSNEHKQDLSYSSSPEYARFFEFPPIHQLSSSARLFQLPFLPLARRRKHLILPDWTSHLLAKKRGDTLTQNSPFPWKSYYFQLKRELLEEAEQIFPVKIDSNVINGQQIQEALGKASPIIPPELFEVFAQIIYDEYKLGRTHFMRAYALYKDLFLYYRPTLVSIPAETQFAYVLSAQVAKSLGIKTQLLLDGYLISFDESTIHLNEKGENVLFDKFVAQGQAYSDLLLASGIKKESISLIRPVFLEMHENLPPQDKKYEAIIMAYNAHQLNPQARCDSPFKIVQEIVELLLSMNFSKIAIKLKQKGDLKDPVNARERKRYEDYLAPILKDQKIDFLSGQLYEHINKTSMLIGQITTGVVESLFHNIDYYIYEPFENGKTNELLGSSKIFSLEDIHRNLAQLKSAILEHRPSIHVSQEYVFSGPKLDRSPLFLNEFDSPSLNAGVIKNEF